MWHGCVGMEGERQHWAPPCLHRVVPLPRGLQSVVALMAWIFTGHLGRLLQAW